MMDKIGVRVRDERSVTTAELLNRAARMVGTAQCEIRIESMVRNDNNKVQYTEWAWQVFKPAGSRVQSGRQGGKWRALARASTPLSFTVGSLHFLSNPLRWLFWHKAKLFQNHAVCCLSPFRLVCESIYIWILLSWFGRCHALIRQGHMASCLQPSIYHARRA